MNTIIGILVLVAAIAGQIACVQKVRGVIPERASLYDDSKPFLCLDGSSTIPFEQVNDDYCDCINLMSQIFFYLFDLIILIFFPIE